MCIVNQSINGGTDSYVESSRMNTTKRQRLEAKGWKVTTVDAFLGLTPDDVVLVKARVSEEKPGTCGSQKSSVFVETVSVSESGAQEPTSA